MLGCMRLKFMYSYYSLHFLFYLAPYSFEHRLSIPTFVCAHRTRFENIATYFGYSPNMIVDDINKQVTPATWWHRTSLENKVQCDSSYLHKDTHEASILCDRLEDICDVNLCLQSHSAAAIKIARGRLHVSPRSRVNRIRIFRHASKTGLIEIVYRVFPTAKAVFAIFFRASCTFPKERGSTNECSVHRRSVLSSSTSSRQ